MAGERPTPQHRTFRSEVIVVPNPEISDPVAQNILDTARRSGYPVTSVVAGRRTEVIHHASDIGSAVAAAVDMTEQLLRNPVSEVVKSVKTEDAASFVPKDQRIR